MFDSFRSISGRIGLLLLLVAFIASGTVYTFVFSDLGMDAYNKMKIGTPGGGDFRAFYAGASNIITDPQDAYERPVMRRSLLELHGLEGSKPSENLAGLLEYYNPPLFLALFSPLTLLDTHVAYLFSLGINLAGLLALVCLIGIALRWRHPLTLLTVAALFSFVPLYVTIVNSQPVVLIAALILAAFLAAESRRGFVAAGLLALTAAKPQWLVLPGLALWRNAPRALWALAAIGTLLLLLPFVVMGAEALLDYIALITGRTDADLERARYSMYLFNWAGFLSVLTGSTQPAAAVVLGVLTLGVFGIVLRHGDMHLTWAAAIFTTLIVIPHTHSHEWLMAFPAAVFLLRRPLSPPAFAVTAALLLACHIGLTTSVFAQEAVRNGGRSFYLPIPAAFALVLWCAVLPMIEDRLGDRVRPSASSSVRPVTIT